MKNETTTNSEATQEFSLVLSRSAGAKIRVGLGSFLKFNSDIDHDLEALVGHWSDFITAESLARSSMQDDELNR